MEGARQMTVLNGKYVAVNDSFGKEILALPKVAAVLAQLKLSEADFESSQAYVSDHHNTFTGEIAGIEKVAFVGKKAQLQVIRTHGENADYLATVDVLSEDGYTSRYLSLGSTIEKINEDVLDKGFPVLLANGLKHDEGFELQSTKLDEVAEKWVSFCVPGYKHCGPGCGDNNSWGGGTPVNAIDSCCKAHDRCYSAFGYNDPCCDREVIRCTLANRGVDASIADAIVAAFISNSNRC